MGSGGGVDIKRGERVERVERESRGSRGSREPDGRFESHGHDNSVTALSRESLLETGHVRMGWVEIDLVKVNPVKMSQEMDPVETAQVKTVHVKNRPPQSPHTLRSIILPSFSAY